MKREMKFRGKRIDNGEWAYGGYSKAEEDDGTLYVFILDWCSTLKFTDEDTKFTGHRIKPRTLGQFTGLKDKNGREIYEGDISKIKINIQGGRSVESINKVIYDKGAFHYENIKAKRSIPMFGVGYACEVEMIGNIFDNPELLK